MAEWVYSLNTPMWPMVVEWTNSEDPRVVLSQHYSMLRLSIIHRVPVNRSFLMLLCTSVFWESRVAVNSAMMDLKASIVLKFLFSNRPPLAHSPYYFVFQGSLMFPLSVAHMHNHRRNNNNAAPWWYNIESCSQDAMLCPTTHDWQPFDGALLYYVVNILCSRLRR